MRNWKGIVVYKRKAGRGMGGADSIACAAARCFKAKIRERRLGRGGPQVVRSAKGTVRDLESKQERAKVRQEINYVQQTRSCSCYSSDRRRKAERCAWPKMT
jgi:hypothetical protein